MNIEAEIWYLVTLFAAFELSVNLKVIAKIANAQFQTRIYIIMYKFHIGDHPGNCGDMFADSSGKFQVNAPFQVKVRFSLSNGQRQKGQAPMNLNSLNCFSTMLLSGEITNMHAFGIKGKSLTKQNGKNDLACENSRPSSLPARVAFHSGRER